MITHHLSQILSQPRGHEMPIAGVQSARRRGTVRSVHHCGEYPWKQLEACAGAHLPPSHTWHIQAQGTWPAGHNRTGSHAGVYLVRSNVWIIYVVMLNVQVIYVVMLNVEVI